MQPGLFTRRLALAGASAAAITGLTRPVAAKMPMGLKQAPYFYRFKLGAMEATVVSDGALPLGPPGDAFLGLTPEEIRRQLTDNFLPPNTVTLEQNILVLNTGKQVVLFDTGMGILKNFGPTTGQLMKTLAQAGIPASAVDAVVMTHAHIDHCGGIMSMNNTRNFPNARLYIAQADYDYWTDPAKVSAPGLKDFLAQARRNLVPNRDRIVFVKDGQEIIPGIHAISAPGHTVGHTIFMIDSDGQQLCFIGDLTHHQTLLLEKPLTEFAYDTDPKQSAQSRVKFLTMLAANRIPLLAYHFPWPGIGHVAKLGDGFRYFPAMMTMTL